MSYKNYLTAFGTPAGQTRRNVRTPGTVLLVLVLLCNNCPASSVDAQVFELQEVAQGIFVHTGRHLSVEDSNNGDIANIGFITGERCVAVIDSGGSVATGRHLLAAIRDHTSLPICYVINTHVHFDHVLGNSVFKSSDTRFVGHENLKPEITRNTDFYLQFFSANLGDNPHASAIIGPDITVTTELELDLGNRKLALQAHPVAHTHTDLSIYDRQTGTLWLSDLLFLERIPVLDGSLRGWISTLEQLQKQPAKLVIPGHGPVMSTWPGAAGPLLEYLQALLTQTRAAIARGEFMEDIVASVGARVKLQWQLYDDNHKRNVTRAFSELEWE